MQFQSYLEIFDTRTLTAKQPYSPQGVLFTYYPSEEPESLHYHNFLELGYCERGSGIFIIDGEIIPFSEQCTTIIYDGQVHIAKSISPEKSLWHFLYIDLSKLFSGTEQFDLGLLKVRDHVNFEFPNLTTRSAAPSSTRPPWHKPTILRRCAAFCMHFSSNMAAISVGRNVPLPTTHP